MPPITGPGGLISVFTHPTCRPHDAILEQQGRTTDLSKYCYVKQDMYVASWATAVMCGHHPLQNHDIVVKRVDYRLLILLLNTDSTIVPLSLALPGISVL